jgi:hypothetical protein
MEITNTLGGVKFRWDFRRERVIPHGQITDCDLHISNLNPPDYRIIVRSGASDREQHIVFDYSAVTVPVTASASDLRDLILVYNLGAGSSQTYVALAGQVIFTTTFPLGSSVLVFVNGALQAPANYAYTVGGTTVTFAAPMVGGEQVIIYSI